MDPDPDLGVPKTCGSDGSGSGFRSGFGSGSGTLRFEYILATLVTTQNYFRAALGPRDVQNQDNKVVGDKPSQEETAEPRAKGI